MNKEENIYKEISKLLTVEYGYLNISAYEKITSLFEEEQTKALTLGSVVESFCECKLKPYYFDEEFNRKCTECNKHQC